MLNLSYEKFSVGGTFYYGEMDNSITRITPES